MAGATSTAIRADLPKPVALMQAASTGKRADIKAVTDQLEIVLRAQQML